MFPDSFISKKVLNVGSFNVNGSERIFFNRCDIVGLDIAPGEGVDVVCPAQDYDMPDGYFDTVISCECWEHNPFYKESIINAIRMLKSGGLFLFTCATTGRPVHGVSSLENECREKYPDWVTMPNAQTSLWDSNYYKNVSIDDVLESLDVDSIFSRYAFEVNRDHKDLYFWGVKN